MPNHSVKVSGFTLSDYRRHLDGATRPEIVQKMLQLPGMEGFNELEMEGFQRDVKRYIGVIDAMTKGEREAPELIDAERARRIARGSGTTPQTVTDLVQQFGSMKRIIEDVDVGPQRPMWFGRPPDN